MPGYSLHVFEHKDGRYQTTRAQGLSKAEERALEQFFFGQSNDPDYLSSLSEEPGLIWRHVGDKAALTRVTQGNTDTDGRATLRFETMVESSSLGSLHSQVAEFARGEWDLNATGRLETHRSRQLKPDLHPQALSEVLFGYQNGNRIVANASEFSIDDVGEIIKRLGADETFSLSFKSLNPRAPVSVNLVANATKEARVPMIQKRQLPTALPRPQVEARASSTPTAMFLITGVLAIVVLLQSIALVRGNSSNRTEIKADPQNVIMDHTQRKVDEATEQVTGAIQAMGASSEEKFAARFDSMVEATEKLKKDFAQEWTKTRQDLVDLKDSGNKFDKLGQGVIAKLEGQQREIEGLSKSLETLQGTTQAISRTLDQSLLALSERLAVETAALREALGKIGEQKSQEEGKEKSKSLDERLTELEETVHNIWVKVR